MSCCLFILSSGDDKNEVNHVKTHVGCIEPLLHQITEVSYGFTPHSFQIEGLSFHLNLLLSRRIILLLCVHKVQRTFFLTYWSFFPKT